MVFHPWYQCDRWLSGLRKPLGITRSRVTRAIHPYTGVDRPDLSDHADYPGRLRSVCPVFVAIFENLQIFLDSPLDFLRIWEILVYER